MSLDIPENTKENMEEVDLLVYQLAMMKGQYP
jgi:hypothetical protein